MSVGVAHDSAHAHLWSALDQTVGHESVRVGNTVQRARDGQDTVMHAWHDLADTSADSGLVAQVCDVLARLANDDAGFLGGDNGTEGELRLSVLFLGAGTILGVEGAHLLAKVVNARVDGWGNVFGGHGGGGSR